MPDEITLDKEVFKALAGDTRVSVLKALLERRKTQSELAKEMNLAAPTIKDHVDILQKAGLVVEMDEGHKWKYIQLTVKGKTLLHPEDKRILVLLGTSLVGIAASAYLVYAQFADFFPASFPSGAVSNMSALAVEKTAEASSSGGAADAVVNGAVVAPQAPAIAAGAAEVAVQVIPSIPIPELAVLVTCLVVFGISVGMWIKQSY